MSAIDEIKSKLDIVEYIQRSVPLKKAGRVFKANCPFHHEKTPSFVVDPDRQTWRCFGACAEGGDLFSFAMKQSGWSFHEAMEELAKLAGVELHPQTPEQQARTESLERLRGLLKIAADFYHEQLLDGSDREAAATLKYARQKRGLSDETIARFQIGYAPQGWQTLHDLLTGMGYSDDDLIQAGVVSQNEQGKIYDRFRNRLMIPIRDERGRVVGFGARVLAADDNPKYLNSPQSPVFDKSRLLFGLDFAARDIRTSETVVIVEGYLDAIQAHQAGYTNVVAQMGTALTETQLKLVAPRWAKKIVLALDSDAAGQSATRRSLDVLQEGIPNYQNDRKLNIRQISPHEGLASAVEYSYDAPFDIRILELPNAKDPDDLIRESPSGWQQLVDNSVPIYDYIIEREVRSLPSNASLAERTAVAKRLLGVLHASERGSFDTRYNRTNLQKLSIKLKIVEQDLFALAIEEERKAPKSKIVPLQQEEIPPPEDGYFDLPDFDQPVGARQGVQPPPISKPKLERYCLRILFAQPDLFYHVNRKFRELAGDNDDLTRGPLGDFGSDDFTHSTYHALMRIFEEALAQDALDAIEYINAQLTPELIEEINDIFLDDFEEMRPVLRHGLSADLTVAQKHQERHGAVLDIYSELTHKALELRQRRLMRVRQEIITIFADGQLSLEDAAYYNQVAILTNHAKRLIDDEIGRQARKVNA